MIDLHAHTSCSDGSFSPAQLVRLAAEKKLTAVAVTDHDTTAGLAEACRAGAEAGVEVVPGIEFSSEYEHRTVHLTALFIDAGNEDLQRGLAWAKEQRDGRNERMLRKLRDAGFDIDPARLPAEEGRVLTRGNIAQLLVDKGYAASVKEGMTEFLVRGKVGFVEHEMLSPADCIRLAHAAGGRIFVAHINQIDRKDPENGARIAETIIRIGADGLETLYAEYDLYVNRLAEGIAVRTGCLRSGGSDFHGALKPGLELGTGYGDLYVPDLFLTRIRESL